MKRILLTTLIGIFIAVNVVSAQTLDFYLSSDEMWINDYIDFTCLADNITGPYHSTITFPIYYPILPMSKINDSYYTYRFTPQRLGTFEAYCSNGSVASTSKSFVVSALVVDIIEADSVYSDEEVQLSAKLYKEDDTVQEIGFGTYPIFSLYLDGSEKTSGYNYYTSWNIQTTESSFTPKEYVVRLEVEYEGRTNYSETVIEVKPAFDLTVTNTNSLNIKNGEEITVQLSAKYHGMDVLATSTITATLNGQTLSFSRTSTGLSFNAPTLNPGTYNLVITSTYNGFQDSETRQLDYVIPVHGEVIDSDGTGVSGNMKFTKDGYSKTINIASGLYSDNIPYGTYEVLADFSKLKARFVNVPVNNEIENMIRYDTFTSLDMDGLMLAGGYAIEFTPSFQRAYIEADYDAGRVIDETKIEVYKCGNWNLDASKCNGDWTKIPRDINMVNNKVNFQVDSLSAFVIGEMKELSVSASIDKSQYYFDQEIKLTGVVKDKDNKIVPGASVHYEIDGISGTITTETNGVFSVDIPVPRIEGRNILTINATRDFYESSGTILGLAILRKNELNMIIPTTTEIGEGEETSLDLILVNSGDTVLHNVIVSITGLPADSDYEPKTMTGLLANEQKTIRIMTNPEPDDKRVYTITVSIDSDETSYTDSFVLTVKRNHTQDQTNQTQTNETIQPVADYSFDFSFVTAYVTANGTAIVNTGSIIASVLIIAFFAVKTKRKKAFTLMTRYYVMHLLNTIKNEVLRDMKTIKPPPKERLVMRASGQSKPKKKPIKRKPKKQEEYVELQPHMTGVG